MSDPVDKTTQPPPEWEPEPLHLPLHLPLDDREPASRKPSSEERPGSTVIVIDLC